MAKIFFDCTICCEKCDSKLYCFAEARACFSENFLKAFSSNNSNFEIKEIYLKNPSFISEWSMIGGDFYCFDHAKDALKESIIKDFKRTLAIKKVDVESFIEIIDKSDGKVSGKIGMFKTFRVPEIIYHAARELAVNELAIEEIIK
jgi:hypothetical protein